MNSNATKYIFLFLEVLMEIVDQIGRRRGRVLMENAGKAISFPLYLLNA